MIELPEAISEKVLLWEACEKDNPLRQILEAQFAQFIMQNDLTLEEMFKNSFMDNLRMNVSFLPTTPSYEKYGRFATLISVEADDKEKERLCNSLMADRKTKGKLRFKALLDIFPVKEEIIEIDTNDVYAIEVLKK